MSPLSRLSFGLGAGLAFAWAQPAFTQDRDLRDRPIIYYYSPGTPWSAELHGYADQLRAYGEASVDVGYAHFYHSNAYSIDLDNWLKELVIKHERERLGLERRKRMHRSLLQITELQNKKFWKMIRNYPELSTGSIESGRALNFLLDRMSGGLLAYKLSPNGNDLRIDENAVKKLLTVTPDMLSGLRVRQELGSGQSIVFHLDDGQPLDIGWWPPVLREVGLDPERTNFELARAELMAADEQSFRDSWNQAAKAFAELKIAFEEHNPKSKALASTVDHRRYLTGERFLKSLFGELTRIEDVGTRAVTGDSLKFEGDNLVSMLTHMSRNGLEFVKASPGDEQVYKQVFQMMRDLYVVIEDNAEEDQNEAAAAAPVKK